MAVDSIKGSLKEKGVRLTRQRALLLELIDKSGEHLDAERLFQLAKEKDPKLNRVTVYRTLKLLKQGGLVDELDLMHLQGEKHFYERRPQRDHLHMACLRCGKIMEFESSLFERLKGQVERECRFHIVVTRVEMGGYCTDCRTLASSARGATAFAGAATHPH